MPPRIPCPQIIYMFLYVSQEKKIIKVFTIQPTTTGFYNPDEKCLQRGTDWVFK